MSRKPKYQAKPGGIAHTGLVLEAKTENQHKYIDALNDPKIRYIFCTGLPGTGKTILACQAAIQALMKERYSKILCCRSTIGIAGQGLGWLPGELNSKLYAWLLPITEHADKFVMNLEELVNNGRIDFVSLEHVRGRSLEDAFVITTEAQNLSFDVLKCLLTRVDYRSKLILDGDFNQNDMKKKGRTDFEKVCEALDGMDSFRHIQFTKEDIIRSKDIAEILERLEKVE